MNKILQRTLMAYRPLYLNGLLLDGQYRLPKADPPDVTGPARMRRRTLLAALTHVVFHPRSK
ncbi:MAG: hypothetical protein ACYC0F_11660 [Rhodanobacter sp.]